MIKNLFSLFLHRVERIAGAFCIALFSCLMIVLFTFWFVIRMPSFVFKKGETTRMRKVYKSIVLGFCSYIFGFIAGKKAPKCVSCGATDFFMGKTKDGYNASWAKVDGSTGEALCTACEDSVELID